MRDKGAWWFPLLTYNCCQSSATGTFPSGTKPALLSHLQEALRFEKHKASSDRLKWRWADDITIFISVIHRKPRIHSQKRKASRKWLRSTQSNLVLFQGRAGKSLCCCWNAALYVALAIQCWQWAHVSKEIDCLGQLGWDSGSQKWSKVRQLLLCQLQSLWWYTQKRDCKKKNCKVLGFQSL